MEAHLQTINVAAASFCKRLQKLFEDEPCLTYYSVSPDAINCFIKFNHEMMHPVKDVVRMLNEELERHMIKDGWDKFYIRQNKTGDYGRFCNEWECISLNLINLKLTNFS